MSARAVRPAIVVQQLLLVAVVCLAPISALGQTPRPAPRAGVQPRPAARPVFSDEDQAIALGSACGAIEPGSANRQIVGLDQTEPVPGYLSADKASLHRVIISESYVVKDVVRHVLMTARYSLQQGAIADSGTQTIGICADLLEFHDGMWGSIHYEPELVRVRQMADPPRAALRQIGASRHAIELTDMLFAGGRLQVVRLYEATASRFPELLAIRLGAEMCVADRPCIAYRGALAYRPVAGAAAFDIRLTLQGTYLNDAGSAVAIPAAPITLRLQDGTYQPTGSTPAVRALWKMLTIPSDASK